MALVFFILITTTLIQLGFTANDPPPDGPKEWPHVFSQQFVETSYRPNWGTHVTFGTYYYDYTNKRARLDRDNGRWDTFCGYNGDRKGQDTPCTHLVVDGKRWLLFPKYKDCCL